LNVIVTVIPEGSSLRLQALARKRIPRSSLAEAGYIRDQSLSEWFEHGAQQIRRVEPQHPGIVAELQHIQLSLSGLNLSRKGMCAV
jgi:hypothetical protein